MLGREPRRFWYALSAVICFLVVLIAFRGRLGYFIHPRYFLFTTICSAVGAVILLKAALSYKYEGKQSVVEYGSLLELGVVFGRWLLGRGAWILVIIALILAWAPARPLMSNAADRRDQGTTSMSDEDKQYLLEASWFDNPKTLNQLSQVLSAEEGRQVLLGKSFKLTGFVRANSDGDSDVFQLSRFIITCCAVDATPSAIKVFKQNWQSNFKVDDWVEVDGRLEVLKTDHGQQLLLNGSVRQIPQPAEPYDYLSF